MLDQLDDAREQRHHRTQVRLGVETEGTIRVEQPDRCRTTLCLDAQREEEARVHRVADEERAHFGVLEELVDFLVGDALVVPGKEETRVNWSLRKEQVSSLNRTF